MRRSHRLVLLLLLLAAAIAMAVWAAPRLGWPALARHQQALLAFVAAHPFAAALLYVLAYVLTAALSLPHAVVLTVTGGLLFGAVLGGALTIIGATAGASLLVLAVRTALGDALTRRGGKAVRAVQRGLRRDGFSYLMALRLVPLVPFWAVNLAAAVAGMRLAVFVPATALGIAPVTFVFSSLGAGVGGVLAAGQTPDLSALFAPEIVLPLIGLAILSLLPVAWRRLRPASA